MRRKLLLLLAGVLGILFLSFFVWLYPQYEVPIFMYHSLDAARLGEYSVVLPENFRTQMEYIKRKGYHVVLLKEYCARLKRGEDIPRNTVVITFDDGHRDNVGAARILDELDIPATIFLIVGNIDKEKYLSSREIKQILAETPVTIGSHTLSHRYLPRATDEEVIREIKESRRILEETFGVPVETITYPIGGFDKRVLRQVHEAGYLCGCTTNRGFSRRKDRYALRRIKITERDVGFRFWAKLSGFYNVFKKPKNPY